MSLLWRLFIVIVVDIDVAVLSLCLRESIYRSGSCYLHQNRSPGRTLCYIGNIAFLVGAVAVDMIAPVVGAVDYYSSVQDSRVVLLCLRLMVSFCLFSR